MTATQVIPFGDGQFLIRLFAVSGIPDRVDFKGYYEGWCRIKGKDGRSTSLNCVVHRPGNRRNVFGIRTADELVVLVQTGLAQAELARADIQGAELSEAEAKARLRRT